MKNLSFPSFEYLNYNKVKFQIVLTLFILLFSFNNKAVSQEWLFFPEDISANRVDIGDLDVAGNQITVEALISSTKPEQNAAYNIVSKHRLHSDVNYLLRAGSFQITTTSGFISVENPITLCSDSTYHVAGSYDGDSVRFFVNGTQVASVNWSGDLILNEYTSSIGNRSLDPTEQYHGYIDEVRIWNIARTQEDIYSNMYNISDPQQESGLLAYYQFEGNYVNVQGNSSWNGVAVGTDFSFAENPYFNGLVSGNFCGPSGYNEVYSESSINFSPNPSSNKITFTKDVEYVIIYNPLGKVILNKKLTSNTISVARLNKGIYIVEMISNNTRVKRKLIIN